MLKICENEVLSRIQNNSFSIICKILCRPFLYFVQVGWWFPYSNNQRTSLEKINKCTNGSESKFSWKWFRIAEYGLSVHNLKLVRPLFRPIYCLQTKRPLTRLFKLRRIFHTSPVINQYKTEAPSFCILDGLPSWLKLITAIVNSIRRG